MTEKRVTVDFDEESYYLDGEYWESWDNYGEEMADAINELLNEESNKREQENEELRKELKVYRKVASCSNCNYHNYDWFDDGDEFEVCDKGNDVTEGICEEWREL